MLQIFAAKHCECITSHLVLGLAGMCWLDRKWQQVWICWKTPPNCHSFRNRRKLSWFPLVALLKTVSGILSGFLCYCEFQIQDKHCEVQVPSFTASILLHVWSWLWKLCHGLSLLLRVRATTQSAAATRINLWFSILRGYRQELDRA